jgi:hypothetical protein
MPNLQQFRWYRDGTQGVPGQPARYRVEGRIEEVNPNTGLYEALFDFTGANRLTYPHDVINWTDEQRTYFLNGVARLMVNIASGGALEPLPIL